MNEIDEFLNRPLLARLATADPEKMQPHVVPVWYGWDSQSLWISAFRSTRKVKELRKNPNCSIVIDLDDAAGGIRAVLMEGAAELVTSPQELLEENTTWIYTRYLGSQGVLDAEPQSWINDPENLLIKLTPAFLKTWK